MYQYQKWYLDRQKEDALASEVKAMGYAVKFYDEEKGIIEIRTYNQDAYVCVDITDTGKGIQPENLQKIFDPFFTTKRDKGGTGLGLSVVKSIIDSHRATIDINNKIKGDGVVVTLRFKA